MPHRCIVQLCAAPLHAGRYRYEVHETPSHLQIVLELVQGGELADRLAEQESYSEAQAAATMKAHHRPHLGMGYTPRGAHAFPRLPGAA
jgi:hypothetical protein